MPARDSLVVAAVVAAKEIPARPKTDKALFDRLPLPRFNCDMGSSIPIQSLGIARSIFSEQGERLNVSFTFVQLPRKIVTAMAIAARKSSRASA
jgi:hypothetical protein